MDKGCGHRLNCGHGHTETCGREGQMGVYECDGCKLKKVWALVEALGLDRAIVEQQMQDVEKVKHFEEFFKKEVLGRKSHYQI